ncbi:MAG: hypothetical protein AB1411_02975 [Nitrospirota bacterium]
MQTDTSPEIENYQVKTVAVVPFQALPTPQIIDLRDSQMQGPQGAVRSDISLAIPQTIERYDQPTATVPPQAAEKLTRIFYGKLKVWQGLKVLSPEETAQAVKKLGDTSGLTPEQVAKRVAKQLSADAALIGRVLIYQERVGGKLGAQPATVGFEVKLVSVDGRVLWVGNYFEKQRPMIEDLPGFVQRGGVFVTADELAQYGAEHVVKDFPFGVQPEK